MLIADGIVRMRWRDNWIDRVRTTEPSAPLEPGRVYEVHVSAWNTSYVFNRGHQIRVAVSSSNAPRFSANPNNGLSLIEAGAPVLARNTVHFSRRYPSRFVLPVVSLADMPHSPVVGALSASTDEPGVVAATLRKVLQQTEAGAYARSG